jgi:hypothetical protein
VSCCRNSASLPPVQEPGLFLWLQGVKQEPEEQEMQPADQSQWGQPLLFGAGFQDLPSGLPPAGRMSSGAGYSKAPGKQSVANHDGWQWRK